MLRNEYWVAAKRRLLSIIFRVGRCEARVDEVAGMPHDFIDAGGSKVGTLLGFKVESPAKRRSLQGAENRVNMPHLFVARRELRCDIGQ